MQYIRAFAICYTDKWRRRKSESRAKKEIPFNFDYFEFIFFIDGTLHLNFNRAAAVFSAVVHPWCTTAYFMCCSCFYSLFLYLSVNEMREWMIFSRIILLVSVCLLCIASTKFIWINKALTNVFQIEWVNRERKKHRSNNDACTYFLLNHLV